MRIWVHAGLPKCGSTSVQRYFAANDAINLAQGLCYPVAWRHTNGYRSHEPISRADPSELTGIVDAIRKEAEGSSNILISCEDFANALPEGNAPALVDDLNRKFGADQVNILVYFRNVYQFIESCYAQFILGGMFRIESQKFFRSTSADLASFVRMFEEKKGFPIYSYTGYAGLIAANFPENKVIFKSIEREDLNGLGLVDDLCSMIGINSVGEAKAQNTRSPNIILAAAHYAQLVGSQKAYQLVKADIRKLVKLPRWNERARSFESASFSIDPDLYARIKAQLESEHASFPAIFVAGFAGLCEDRWSERSGKDELTSQEKIKILKLFAMAL